MTGLTMTMVPRILHIADDVRDALASRCVQRRKSPVARIRLFAVPLLIAVSTYVEELAQALEARCFSESRKEAPFTPAPFDAVWLALHVAAAAVVLAGNYLDFF